MANLEDRIGFMQGRLSPMVDGKIQAFPWRHWEDEFAVAATVPVRLMEWTLDQQGLHDNPLLTKVGQQRIGELSRQYRVRVGSLTGDNFMQAPFWKAQGDDRKQLQDDFRDVATACGQVGIAMMVVPLVDNGALANSAQEDLMVEFLLDHRAFLDDLSVAVVFECDFGAQELARFIERLPAGEHNTFGVNYDIGNSAALGYLPTEELGCYGHRVLNVHVKDRVFGGTTVPLGTGSADFASVFAALKRLDYRGNYVLQTARAADGDHAGAVRRYRQMVLDWAAR